MKTFVTLMLCFGIFQNISGQVVNYEIDPTFNAGQLFTKGNVSDLLLYPNGKFLITGIFLETNDGALPTSRLFANGQLDEAYGAGAIKFTFYLNHLLGYGGGVLYRVNPNSPALGQSFRFEFQKPPYNGFISNAVNDILVKDDCLLIVGGIFFTDSMDISPNSLRQLCMIDSTGAPIPGFPMVKCEPLDARIHSIDSLSTGEYIIAGSFSSVNGHLTNNIAKLHADFSVDTSFVSVFGNQGGAVVGEIDSIDRIWVRISNGYLNSNPDSLVYFLRLLSNGDLDTSIQIPTFTSYYNATNPFETGPAAIALLEDNTILLGGNFVEVNGEYHKSMVQLYADGSIVEGAFENLGADEAVWDNWEPALGPIAGTYIRIIKRLPDGKLLLGGSFSSFGGEPRNCLVRLRPDGYVGVDDYKKQKIKVNVFPNPADGFVTVAYNLLHSNENTVLNIYDNIARSVYSIKLGEGYQGEKLIDTRNFTNGIYILEIRQDDIQIEVNKFVVTH